MKCLVTGGAGFLGGHLCRLLIHRGEEVVCLDNLSTGSISNIEELMQHRDFTFIEGDVRGELLIPADRIYNLACPASPHHYRRDPVETLTVTIQGVLNCVEHARRYGSRILQASTSEIYGDPIEHPQVETYWGNVNPVGPRACYTESKRMAETILTNYNTQYNVDVRIARIFNTYGPLMQADDGRVISNFIVQALRGDDITLYGNGTQTRSFCYCDDMVDGLVALMEHSVDVGPMNLGNTAEISISHLAEEIIRLTGSDSRVINCPLPVEDPRRRQPETGLSRRVLGWIPETSLETGLIRTISYFREIIDTEPAAAARTLDGGRQ